MSVHYLASLYILIYTQGIYVPIGPYFIPLNQKLNNSLALGILILLVFPAIIEYNNNHWFRGIDVNTPVLLNDVTESVKSGIPLYRALEDATIRDYGPISKPLEQVVVKLHLGTDFKGALEWLGEELIRPSVKRMTTILIEANEAGGDIIVSGLKPDKKKEPLMQEAINISHLNISNSITSIIPTGKSSLRRIRPSTLTFPFESKYFASRRVRTSCSISRSTTRSGKHLLRL